MWAYESQLAMRKAIEEARNLAETDDCNEPAPPRMLTTVPVDIAVETSYNLGQIGLVAFLQPP